MKSTQDFEVVVGLELVANGRWCVVDEIIGGSVFVVDQDGDCFELLPGMVDHVYGVQGKV